eukprot:UN04627
MFRVNFSLTPFKDEIPAWINKDKNKDLVDLESHVRIFISHSDKTNSFYTLISLLKDCFEHPIVIIDFNNHIFSNLDR